MPGEENGRMTITTQYGPTGEIIRIDTLMEEGPSFQSSNIYRSLDLPLMLGFEYQRGRWSVGLAAGPALNLWFKPEATLLLDNDQDPAFVEGDEAGIFQSTLGLSWLGGADFGYRMQGGWSVQLAAHFHHYPQSFTGESYPLQQHYQTGSLSIGLRKRL